MTDVKYPNVETVIAKVVTDKPVRKTPYQVKGVFMRQFAKEPVIPFMDGSYRERFLYPRVQVKILNEQIYIIGINEGADSVSALSEKMEHLDFGNISFEVHGVDIERAKNQFTPSEQLIRYKFITPWVALNQMTGGRYRFLTNQEKPTFLHRLLGQNILFIANEMGLITDEKIYTKVRVSSLFPRPVDENNWGAFMGEFKTNIRLPNYIGIGNGITRGYGSIYGMFKPEAFQFDEDELKSEVSQKPKKEEHKDPSDNFSDEISEDMEAISMEDVPKPRRTRTAKEKVTPTPKPKKKTAPKKPRKASSKRLLTEEFDIEEEVSFNKKGSEDINDIDDSKFNSEKYHKRQHKS
ncbi:MAG: hypothetical protein HN657_03325 [Candidatus Marinimicrobia bacterium]|jgi:hypothetical protein|nr:hypothetical protein [Candidatus Neomarinimicrobiota bacterium]MBT3497100.1 hypothetical protein [Candidatus Neomarinimicrobiota bacterium]MBT3691935.1 hypothetical protein [Candidatus Neomarinimicrobiota bacterium]MBT3732034.1 hypothetical protein [Candidatus Neomarinimicrobiota bacterium]MBT4144206.1 hypothetical protein [Candidatus Neomarinimicrobiota bacterium]